MYMIYMIPAQPASIFGALGGNINLFDCLPVFSQNPTTRGHTIGFAHLCAAFEPTI